MQLVHRRHFPVEHFVLIDEEEHLAPDALVALARRKAERLARAVTGDSRKFTLIHNGDGLARRMHPHVHIVCAHSRWQKALIYLLIGLKNLLPADHDAREA